MAVYNLYGDMGFTSNQARNRSATRITDEAAARGFTPAPYGDFAAGVVSVLVEGRPGLRMSYTHTDYAVCEESQATLNAYIDQQGAVSGGVYTANNNP